MYASRAPHRVNPIGLTVCRLDSVEGNTLCAPFFVDFSLFFLYTVIWRILVA
jgi:hypothetical protein